MASLIKLTLRDLNFKYILTHKFQTDCLEGTFGIWRQNCDGPFHINLNHARSLNKKTWVINLFKHNDSILKLENGSKNKLEERNDIAL